MPSSISTVRCVGLPSSSTLSEPRRSRDRAVVDDGDALRRDALADAAGERARALAVEVAFEAVADRLVQQDAGPAGAEHDGHRAGGRVARARLSSAWSTACCGVALEHRVGEIAVVEAPAAAGVALLAPAVLLDDHGERHAHQRPHVGGEHAVAARDQDRLVLAGERRHHLRDARIARARHALEPLEQRHLAVLGERWPPDRAARTARARRRRRPSGATADCPWRPIARTARAASLERGERDVVGIRERLLVAVHGAHADAAVDVERARLDDAFLEAPALDARVLEIEVGEVDVVRVDRREHARQLARRRGRRARAAGASPRRRSDGAIGTERSVTEVLRRETAGVRMRSMQNRHCRRCCPGAAMQRWPSLAGATCRRSRRRRLVRGRSPRRADWPRASALAPSSASSPVSST